MREIGKSRVCYEGDGSGGGIGSFFSNLFGGAQPAAAGPTGFDVPVGSSDPTFGGTAPSGGSTGFDVPVGSQDPTGASVSGANAAGGLDIPLTGAIQSGASPFQVPGAPTAPAAASLQSLTGPGAGTGAIPGPGGGAAAIAAPSSLDDGRGIAPTGQTGTQTFGTGAGQITAQPAGQISMADPANPLAAGATPPSAASEIGAARLAAQEGTIQGALNGGTTTGAPTQTSIDKFLADPSGGSLLKALGANANILLPVAGLGAQALQAQKAPEGLNNIRAAADQTSTQSALLQSYLQSGTLPPGLQAGLDQAKEAAKATIRAKYANLPGQSSAMESELANVDQTAAAQGGQLAIQLFSQGMSEANVSNQLYEAILQQSLERDKELSSAVGNFTTALAGGGPSVKLSLG